MKSPLLYHGTRQASRQDGRATATTSSFPRTDYHYHATPRAAAAGPSVRHSPEVYRREMRSFREISKPLMGTGISWQFALETTVLGLVGVLVAWPLISLLIVLAQTARG